MVTRILSRFISCSSCSKKSSISSINETDIRQYSNTRGHESRDIQNLHSTESIFFFEPRKNTVKECREVDHT